MVGEVPIRRTFPRRIRQTLCEMLLGLPRMPSLGRRDYLHRQLVLDYPGLLSVPRDDDPHVDLMELLSAAYDYPGALRAVLDIITHLYVPDPRVAAIKDLIDAVEPEDLLTREERQSALGLLATAEAAVVAGAFHYSTRTTVRDADLDPRDVTAVFMRVERFPGRPERLPLFFEFLDYIAHRCQQSTRAELHEWMDLVSKRLGFVDRLTIDKLCMATDNRLAMSDRFYLIAELRPDRMRTGRFFLAAWRQHENEPEEALYLADQSIAWDEAITSTHELMRELAVNVEATAEERVLELIVPRCLVTHSIDQWRVDSVLPSAIGTNYPLVLRSYDRLEDPAMHGDWGRNWRWLKQHDRVAGVAAIREVESHDLATVQALRGALLRDGPPAIVLMLAPLPPSSILAADAYTAGLRGGAPIMLWSRNGTTADELAESIRSVCTEGLLSLREHVFYLRLRALEEPGQRSAGNHISIIFDDYDRIPERFRGRSRLRSPGQREAS